MNRARWATLGLLLAVPVMAQQPTTLDSTVEAERPWAKGVPPDNQRAALQLFREGNVLLKDTLFKAAAEKYREALGLWDHPGIHYNMALAYLQIAPPEETYTHITAALRYGRAALDADKFEQATRYKTLLEGQLSNVEITCDTDGATVKLDGKLLFTSPGHFKGMVRAGEHTILASKDGYVTTEQTQIMQAGQASSYNLKLFTTEDLTVYRRRFNVAIPWVVVGVGAVMIGASVFMHLEARNSYQAYDTAISGCVVRELGGCTPTLEVSSLKARGDSQQTLAIGGYVVGGVAAAVGAWLVYFNRQQPFRKSVDLAVLPWLSPTSGGALLSMSF
ncbi:MAG: PEGA domain-containing protein [Archangium sp.]|nr:PEGA domain-containing protein [Archangium sp.]